MPMAGWGWPWSLTYNNWLKCVLPIDPSYVIMRRTVLALLGAIVHAIVAADLSCEELGFSNTLMCRCESYLRCMPTYAIF